LHKLAVVSYFFFIYRWFDLCT